MTEEDLQRITSILERQDKVRAEAVAVQTEVAKTQTRITEEFHALVSDWRQFLEQHDAQGKQIAKDVNKMSEDFRAFAKSHGSTCLEHLKVLQSVADTMNLVREDRKDQVTRVEQQLSKRAMNGKVKLSWWSQVIVPILIAAITFLGVVYEVSKAQKTITTNQKTIVGNQASISETLLKIQTEIKQ